MVRKKSSPAAPPADPPSVPEVHPQLVARGGYWQPTTEVPGFAQNALSGALEAAGWRLCECAVARSRSRPGLAKAAYALIWRMPRVPEEKGAAKLGGELQLGVVDRAGAKRSCGLFWAMRMSHGLYPIMFSGQGKVGGVEDLAAQVPNLDASRRATTDKLMAMARRDVVAGHADGFARRAYLMRLGYRGLPPLQEIELEEGQAPPAGDAWSIWCAVARRCLDGGVAYRGYTMPPARGALVDEEGEDQEGEGEDSGDDESPKPRWLHSQSKPVRAVHDWLAIASRLWRIAEEKL